MPSRRSLRSAMTHLFHWARLFRDVLSKMPDVINKSSLWLVILLYSDCDTGLATDIHAASVENCRPLDITRSNSLDPENVFLTMQTWNYFSCCGLCTYQEGCHYFRWESQNRTCSLLSSNTRHEVLKCSYPGNHGCLMSPCGYREVYVPVEGAHGYMCLKAGTDLGSPCNSEEDCGGGLHWECTDGRCRCQLGYLHSKSHRHCQRECDVPGDVFEAYNTTGVRGYNNVRHTDIQFINDCLSECVQFSPTCRHVEHDWLARVCILSEIAWFDVPEGEQLLDDQGWTLYLRQCA